MLRKAFVGYRNLWISVLTLLGAFYLSASSQPSGAGPEAPSVKRVKVAAVEAASDHRELSFSGVTRAVQRARLAFTLGGRVIARPVEVGDRVAEGAVIARLEDLEIRNAVATAEGAFAEVEARVAQAERDLERAEQLLEAKAATAEEVEKTRAALDALAAVRVSSEARVREARRLLDETTLRAPFAGTVTEVVLEPGEYAGPGRSVAVLSGDGSLELEVEVPESVVARVSEGDEVAVHAPYLGRDLEATIHSVGRVAPGPGRLFPVIARLAETPGLVVGATAQLRLQLTTDAALALPIEAVVDPGGSRPTVYRVVREGSETRVERLPVEIGNLLGDSVVVRGELAVGDSVVVGGQRGLVEGERVEVVSGAERGPGR